MTMRTINLRIEQILAIKWDQLDLNQLTGLMYLSFVSAMEFAESLRMARTLYPSSQSLDCMILGEIDTNNLSFHPYHQYGDHSDFLIHFLCRADVWTQISEKCMAAGQIYLKSIQRMSPETRAASVFHREQTLPNIFGLILENKVFYYPNLPVHLQAYRHYLERHIQLDTEENGHGDLTRPLLTTYDGLEEFWIQRLTMYWSAEFK